MRRVAVKCYIEILLLGTEYMKKLERRGVVWQSSKY